MAAEKIFRLSLCTLHKAWMKHLLRVIPFFFILTGISLQPQEVAYKQAVAFAFAAAVDDVATYQPPKKTDSLPVSCLLPP